MLVVVRRRRSASATTLTEALDDVFGDGTAQDNGANGGRGTTGSPADGGGSDLAATYARCCSRPRSKFAAAQKALKAGDLQGYAKAQERAARTLVQQAISGRRQGARADAVAHAVAVGSPSTSTARPPSPSGSASPVS